MLGAEYPSDMGYFIQFLLRGLATWYYLELYKFEAYYWQISILMQHYFIHFIENENEQLKLINIFSLSAWNYNTNRNDM